MSKPPNALAAYLSLTWSRVSITSMEGVQPITLSLYSQQDLDCEVIIAMEVSHSKLVTLGSEANNWIAENEYRCYKQPSDDVECSSEVDSINENKAHVEED